VVAEWKLFFGELDRVEGFFWWSSSEQRLFLPSILPKRKSTPSLFNKDLIFFIGQIYNMAEPTHEEEMPDATSGAEQHNGEIDENDRAEPITKTIRIVCIKIADFRWKANVYCKVTWLYGDCSIFRVH